MDLCKSIVIYICGRCAHVGALLMYVYYQLTVNQHLAVYVTIGKWPTTPLCLASSVNYTASQKDLIMNHNR